MEVLNFCGSRLEEQGLGLRREVSSVLVLRPKVDKEGLVLMGRVCDRGVGAGAGAGSARSGRR